MRSAIVGVTTAAKISAVACVSDAVAACDAPFLLLTLLLAKILLPLAFFGSQLLSTYPFCAAASPETLVLTAIDAWESLLWLESLLLLSSH